jgi:bifunctional DNA-binding transcriptional regulator/antitoxin component of YhaV-PrlF toxin-antitoxin module
MSKVTSKLQVTVPKALAVQYGIRPGDDIRFEAAGEVIRVVPTGKRTGMEGLDIDARLRLFDAATARQRIRDAGRQERPGDPRGWARKELYVRGRPDAD